MLAAGQREAKDWEGGWEKDGFGTVKSLTMTQPTCCFVVQQCSYVSKHPNRVFTELSMKLSKVIYM